MTRARDMANIAAGSFSIPSGSLTNATPAAGSITNSMLASNAITSANLPSGTVLQVKQTIISNTVSLAFSYTNSFSDITGMSVNITPTSTTSKILVNFVANVSNSTTATNHIRLLRDTTVLAIGDSDGNRFGSTAIDRPDGTPYAYHIGNISQFYLDSPATTSAITYKLQATLGLDYSGNFYLNRSKTDSDNSYSGRTASTITVMEIAG